MRRRIVLLIATVIVCISAPMAVAIESEPNAPPAAAVEQPDRPFRRWRQIHDPSTILKAGKRHWCFSTGMGVQAMSSADLSQWRLERPVFERPPAWVTEVVPTQRGHFWAPDIIEWKGRYRLYYSVSAFGKRTSAIALATSRSLDPQADNCGWSDQGIVVQTTEADDFNAIDPAVVATDDGELWLAFGSFWSGIKLIQLDPETGKRLSPDSPMHALAWKEQIEAPAIHFNDGYYYLFVNWGHCCRGVRSTYNIRVGRSREITGPYLDRDGISLLDGGGTLVLDTRGAAIGPGHAAFFEHDGRLVLSYHYYDGERRGQPVMGINKLDWDAQGWPVVADEQSFTGRILGSDNQDNQSPNPSTATAP
jgi:arabinan endo-1,5-alpha-L-arabinosidase